MQPNATRYDAMLNILLLLAGVGRTLADADGASVASAPTAVQPAPQAVEQPPTPYAAHPAYPFPERYGYDAFYPAPVQPQTSAYQEPSGGYVSSLIPATQNALQFTLKALAKFGLFLVGGATLLLVGGVFTTVLCHLTPICVISFPGVGAIDKESMRSMMTPDRISAAAAMIQDAIGKYQRLQRAVGNK